MPLLKRQKTGSVVCISCGSLVGVNDERCYTCGRRNPGLWGYAPLLRSLGNDLGFVPIIVLGSAALYVLCLAIGPAGIGTGPMNFLPASPRSLLLLGASGRLPVVALGHWWTVLSAGWLHGNLLHIVFAMLWIRQLGPATAELYGPGRVVIIYTFASVCGFTLSTLAGTWITVGSSAAIFGLLGAVVHYGRRAGSSAAQQQALYYAIPMFVFGLVVPGIDNFAHAGGFAGGYLVGRWLDPLQPERIQHLLIALLCLLASLAAVVMSVLQGPVLARVIR